MRRIKTILLIFLIILPGLGFVFQGKYLAPRQFDTGIPPRIHDFPGEPVMYSSSGNDIVLYEKKASLSATMKHIQKVYSEWQTNQLHSLKKINEGKFYTTGLMEDGSPELHSPSRGVFDKEAKSPDGGPIWELAKKSGQKDLFLSGNTAGRDQTAFLAWVTESNEPCELGIGIYGGDQMTVWLNGKKIFEKNNVFNFQDYWWHHEKNFVRNDFKMNQSIVNIPLQRGKNILIVRAHQQLVAPQTQFMLFFTANPDPGRLLWSLLREDYPEARESFLDVVPSAWFDGKPDNTWFNIQAGGKHEEDFLKRLTEQPVTMPSAMSKKPDLSSLISLSQYTGFQKMFFGLQQAVEELGNLYPGVYPGAVHIKKLEKIKDESRQSLMAGGLEPGSPNAMGIASQLSALQRQALVADNPMLAGREIVFAKRFTYAPYHYYDEYNNSLGTRFGNSNISMLSLKNGKVRDLQPDMKDGLFDIFDLSFDAQRIVFGYQKPEPEGMRLYEMNADGSALQQITFPPVDESQRIEKYCVQPEQKLARDFSGYATGYGHWTDDMHPCYLPDGRIVFVSTRSEEGVLCGGHTLSVTSLYRTNADGSGLYRLSPNPLHEFAPAVMNDGRIIYNRWEYVDKGVGGCQPLWTMRPSGEANEEIYGNNITDPGVFTYGRSIPGRSDLIVCTGAAHEMVAVGPILLIDKRMDKRDSGAMISLTPGVSVSGMRSRLFYRNARWVHDIYGQVYTHPFPLADPETNAGGGSFFLVSANKGGFLYDKKEFSLYLIDRFGNKVLLHEDPDVSCFQPVLFAPRPVPPIIPEQTAAEGRQNNTATIFMTDVYQGLEEYGIERGDVKYLRVNEYIPRPWSAYNPWGGDGAWGQMAVISKHTRLWVQVVNGIVPVNPDGSAHFTVPANKNIFLQALDKDFQEIQRMRTTVNFQPGERRSCIGCHETRLQAPDAAGVLAMGQKPLTPRPQPGEVAPRPVHYPTDVQPIWDKHCISCHSGSKPKANLNLSDKFTMHFNVSYENLIDRQLVSYIQEFAGPAPGSAMRNIETIPPKSTGSHASKLVDILKTGHEGVQLSQEEWVSLVTWIDANSPFYGSYFGRRNIRHIDHPDFRPVPDLTEARGILIPDKNYE